MSRDRSVPDASRWVAMTRRLLRWVDADRGAELRMHIDDAAAAGEPFGPGDAVSVLGMVARTQVGKAIGQAPLIVAGLPIVLFCLVAYSLIYESHFAPWDLMEDVPATNPVVAWLRRAVDLAWLVLLPLWAASGWRVACSVRQGRLLLPAIYVVGLIALITQADIFVERTAWFANGRLDAGDVDHVSPYSLALISLVVLIPIAYVVLDVFDRVRRRPAVAVQRSESELVAQSRFDPLALGAIAAPCLIMFVPIVPLVLFLLLCWLAPSFQLRHKAAAAAVLFVPLVTAILLGGAQGIDDPGPVVLGFVGAFVLVWGWLATVTLRAWRVGLTPVTAGPGVQT